jgi:hypothetical protein
MQTAAPPEKIPFHPARPLLKKPPSAKTAFGRFEGGAVQLKKTRFKSNALMPYQNISAALSDTQRIAVIQHFTDAAAIMPFVVNLTMAERIALPKMADGNLPFVGKALAYAEANPMFVPPYANVPELRKDFNLSSQLTLIAQSLNMLAEKVNDTNTAVGSEAYVTALAFYNTVKQAAKMNVPGADAIYQDLRTRFPGNPTPPPPNP